MRRHDRTRKQYHNRYSDGKWGDATYYDMCINSSPLGIEKTVNVLENYVKERTGNQEL
jgi:cytidylate kinase